MTRSRSTVFRRAATAALLATGLLSALPASARPLLCTAQGKCVNVDTCRIQDGSACGTDSHGTACYYGGKCYGSVNPNVTSPLNEAKKGKSGAAVKKQLGSKPAVSN